MGSGAGLVVPLGRVVGTTVGGGDVGGTGHLEGTLRYCTTFGTPLRTLSRLA